MMYDPAENYKYPGDLLVGIVYNTLSSQGNKFHVQRLPLANIPPEIIELDLNLPYTVKYRIEFAESPILFQIGDRIISINCRRPYVGWLKFKEHISFFIEILKKSQLIIPKYHGIRYIDFIKCEDMKNISELQLEIKVGKKEIKDEPIQLKIKLNFNNKEHNIQITSPAWLSFTEYDRQEGTLIDLETREASPNDWDDITEKAIDELHEASKVLFFTELLTPDLIEKFEPVY